LLLETKIIILHRFPYSDSSLIVRGFCSEFGVLSFLIKGAKRKDSPFKGALDPLAESEIVFHNSGKSDLHFIREASLINWFPHLRKDLEKQAMAEVMAEILLRYVPSGLSLEREFGITEQAFQELDNGNRPEDSLARWLFQICDAAGYAISLSECVRCGKTIPHIAADFLPEEGGCLCKECLGIVSSHQPYSFLSDLQKLLLGETLSAPHVIENEFFKYLKTHLGESREIKSFHWLQEVRNYAFSKTNS